MIYNDIFEPEACITPLITALGRLLPELQSPNANTYRHPSILLGVKSSMHIDHASRFRTYKFDEAGDYQGTPLR